MSWLSELRNLPKNPTIWYDALAEHSLHFGSLARICPFEIVRVKSEIVTFDLMHTQKPFLVGHVEQSYPHIIWLRDNVGVDKVAAIYTQDVYPIASKLAKVSDARWLGGIALQGFMFSDPQDAVLFKLTWSQYLC